MTLSFLFSGGVDKIQYKSGMEHLLLHLFDLVGVTVNKRGITGEWKRARVEEGRKILV